MGDKPPEIVPDNNNIIVLKTSVNKKNILPNVIVRCAAVSDKFVNIIYNPKLSIGFCGHTGNGRKKWLDYLINIMEIETDFILRDSYMDAKIIKRRIG